MAVRPARDRSRAVRDAPGQIHAGASNWQVCRAGLLQLAQIGEREHRALVAQEEMRRAGSLLLRIAHETSVPAGHALAVDREAFAAKVTAAISSEPAIKVIRREVTAIDEHDGLTVIATGPLTSDALSQEIARLSG